MDDGDAVRPPYQAALALGSWAWAHRSLIEGRVALAGGNPEDLTYRTFLDCGYALFVEAFLRAGADFVTAIDKVEEALNGGLAVTDDAPAAAPAADRVPTAADNDRALRELQEMMGGL